MVVRERRLVVLSIRGKGKGERRREGRRNGRRRGRGMISCGGGGMFDVWWFEMRMVVENEMLEIEGASVYLT